MTQNEKTLGQKVDEMTTKISEISAELGDKFEASAKESKKIARGLGKWWNHASLETRITTILGGFFVIIALWNLKEFIGGIVLLTLGILLITGVFDAFVQDGLSFLKEKLNAADLSKKEKKNQKSDSEE